MKIKFKDTMQGVTDQHIKYFGDRLTMKEAKYFSGSSVFATWYLDGKYVTESFIRMTMLKEQVLNKE